MSDGHNLSNSGCIGSYSYSPWLEVIKRRMAEYIMERDGGIKSDWKNIIMCAAAREGNHGCLKLLTGALALATGQV